MNFFISQIVSTMDLWTVLADLWPYVLFLTLIISLRGQDMYLEVTDIEVDRPLLGGTCCQRFWTCGHDTGCANKNDPLVFDNNFGKCGLIFKILSPIDSSENSLCTYTKVFTSPALLLHYLVKFENPKMLLILAASRTVDIFPAILRTLWVLVLT